MFAGQINQITSISEEEIYFNLMHRNNYSLLDGVKSPKTKLNSEITRIIIIGASGGVMVSKLALANLHE